MWRLACPGDRGWGAEGIVRGGSYGGRDTGKGKALMLQARCVGELVRGNFRRGARWLVQVGVARQLQAGVDQEEGQRAYLTKGYLFSGDSGSEIHKRGRSTVEEEGEGRRDIREERKEEGRKKVKKR